MGGHLHGEIHSRCDWQLSLIGSPRSRNRPFALSYFPRGFREGSHSLEQRSHGEHRVVRSGLDTLCLGLRPLRAKPCWKARSLVLHSRGSYGYWRNNPELEQGMAALVLAILASYLAGELLDRAAARWPPRGPTICRGVGSLRSNIRLDLPPGSIRSNLSRGCLPKRF